MDMKKSLVILCLAALLPLSGCGTVQEIMASEEMTINTTEELYQQVGKAWKEGNNEVAFVTEDLSQEDLNLLNQEHDGF